MNDVDPTHAVVNPIGPEKECFLSGEGGPSDHDGRPLAGDPITIFVFRFDEDSVETHSQLHSFRMGSFGIDTTRRELYGQQTR